MIGTRLAPIARENPELLGLFARTAAAARPPVRGAVRDPEVQRLARRRAAGRATLAFVQSRMLH